ncbi:MAG: arginine--tRNA ligase [Lachnospiraceae bacterium]|nr:arginine--tRNA ligase [Lachnospiraceae bacterium]
MKDLIKNINEEIKKAYVANGYDPTYAYISVSGFPDLADYQINTCFNLAKILKKNPLDVASEIASIIKDISIDGIKVFENVEPSKPGFVNLKINDLLLSTYMSEVVTDEKLGIDKVYISDNNLPKGILLDYGGANVAKPLHVGHLRVAVIGEALKRLYNRLSIKTIADVHLGDYGLQMGLVIEELKDEGKLQDFTISDLEIVYPKASLRAKGDKIKGIEPDIEFNKRAHESTKKLQDNIEPELSIWKKILEISIEDLKKRYAELNVSFDYYYGESTVKDIMGPMVDDLIKSGIAYESDGAYVIDVKEDTDKKEMPPCIVRKSDGAVLYATSDLATIKFREENFDVDEYVYVVDKRQSLHLEQCFRAAKIAGLVKGDKKFMHVAVGTMNGPDGKPFKSRDGGVVKLETLINEAKEKAKVALKENDRSIDESDIEKIAKIIAIAALKYGDLSNSPTRDYNFSIDKFLSFQGNTGPYILYTLVRIKSIYEKMSLENVSTKKDVVVRSIQSGKVSFDSVIHKLLLKAIRYKDVLLEAYKSYDPSVICKYIYELSNDFNSFYHEHSIINESDSEKKSFYIFILDIVDKIVRDALSILAIDVPDRM